MVNINLLSWRLMAYHYQKKMTRRIFFGTLSMSVLLLLSFHAFFVHQNDSLKKNIIKFDRLSEEIASQKTLPQVDFLKTAFQEWQKITIDRKEKISRLLHHLAKMNSNEIYFTEMSFMSNKVVFKGVSHTAEDFTRFIKNFSETDLFSVITIDELNQSISDSKVAFQFTGLMLPQKSKRIKNAL